MKDTYRFKDTICTIVCDDDLMRKAKDLIYDARQIVEAKVADDEFFKVTYYPYEPRGDDHPLIQRMCEASILSDVGPMAGVAGAVAVYAVEGLVEAGAKKAIVENGGDIAFYSEEPVLIELFADHPTLKDVAFMMDSDRITGVCSSSAKIGPSVSLGDSNVCTVFSDNVILADCCATALGNMVKDERSLSDSLERIGSIEGVKGCLACIGDKVAMYGDVPAMVHLK